MGILQYRPIAFRWLLAVLVLCLGNFLVQPSEADEPVVQNGQSYEDALAKQETVIRNFSKSVELSPYEVINVSGEITGGFVSELTPVFSTELKNPGTQLRLLTFVRNDPEFLTYVRGGEAALMKKVLRSDEELVEWHVFNASVGEKKIPIIIFVKTRAKGQVST